jgi:hypothetical protein
VLQKLARGAVIGYESAMSEHRSQVWVRARSKTVLLYNIEMSMFEKHFPGRLYELMQEKAKMLK